MERTKGNEWKEQMQELNALTFEIQISLLSWIIRLFS